jgi:hypothetical protein
MGDGQGFMGRVGWFVDGCESGGSGHQLMSEQGAGSLRVQGDVDLVGTCYYNLGA